MAGKTVPYVVRDGDYLTSIAHAHGLAVADIWNDGMNSALRKLRSSPDMLAPGDVLYVPVVQRKWIRLDTGSTNVLVATVPTVAVEIKLRQGADDGSNLLSGKAYVIQGLSGGDVQGVFDDEGTVKFRAPVIIRQVVIASEELGLRLPVRIGGLDPIDTASGLAHRLVNLGYSDHARTPEGGVAASLMAFQKDQGLPESGTLDAATAKALVDAHGT